MSSDRIENNEAESLGVEDAKIGSLLNGLSRVSAPAGFDARVKSKIAGGRPQSFGFPLALRYAVPLVLVLLIGGYFVVDRIYFADREVMSPVASGSSSTQKEDSNPVAGNQDTGTSIAQNVNTQNETQEPKIPNSGTKTDRREGDVARSNNNSGGSTVSAGNQTNVILPKGIGTPGKSSERPNNSESVTSLPIQEVLKFIGAAADFEGGGWTIKSVGENTAAERSGIKAGDVILAIDNKPLTKTTEFKGGFEAKSVKVRRGSATMQLQLINK